MELDDYQTSALKTAIYNKQFALIYPALGLAGEAGEVADKVKKMIRDNGGIMTEGARTALAKEIGDVLWYVATMAHDLGYTLEDIAVINLNKLSGRAKSGTIGGSGDDR